MSWQAAAMWPQLAELEAEKSKCQRLQVGCVLTREDRFLSGGFNQHPSGECLSPDIPHHRGEVIHAELAAVLAAPRPAYLVGAEAWVTHSPCEDCALLLAHVGIVHVHYGHLFRSTVGIEILSQRGVVSGTW